MGTMGTGKVKAPPWSSYDQMSLTEVSPGSVNYAAKPPELRGCLLVWAQRTNLHLSPQVLSRGRWLWGLRHVPAPLLGSHQGAELMAGRDRADGLAHRTPPTPAWGSGHVLHNPGKHRASDLEAAPVNGHQGEARMQVECPHPTHGQP